MSVSAPGIANVVTLVPRGPDPPAVRSVVERPVGDAGIDPRVVQILTSRPPVATRLGALRAAGQRLLAAASLAQRAPAPRLPETEKSVRGRYQWRCAEGRLRLQPS
jgi:hypothetical protein